MTLYTFRLPDVGEGVAEAELVKWYVKPGDEIAEDDLLADVMTDKANVEITSPVAGTVMTICGAIGSLIAIGSTLVEIGLKEMEEGASRESKAAFTDLTATLPPAIGTRAHASQPRSNTVSDKQVQKLESSKERVLASPATRRRAFERGIPLQFVQGTGPAGRILLSDLDAAAEGVAPIRKAEKHSISEIQLVGLRRRVAEKMQESKRHIPHFSYVEEFDVTALEELRSEMNSGRRTDEDPQKITLLPFFMQALKRLVPAFPKVNAHYDESAGVLKVHDALNIGIATQTDEGLLVPVVRHAEALNIWEYARELSRVTKAARAGRATRNELSGSTITLTSLGALGGIAATPIINHPEVAILGPNKIREKVEARGGMIVVRKVMNMSASFDHRVIDGYDAACFIQAMKRLVEQPALLFMEPTK